jgi:hypothetical protein
MRSTTCDQCGEKFAPIANKCVLEIDERSIENMFSLLAGEVASLQCNRCELATTRMPTIVVWIDRKTRAQVLEGGPWTDGKRAADIWPRLAVEIIAHDSLESLHAAMDARYIKWLDLFVEATQQLGTEQESEWFDRNCESLGAEIYVAALLAEQNILSRDHAFEYTDAEAAHQELEELVGMVQCRACFAMCARWGALAFSGNRLQDCISAIVH